jgi:predicted signal transduction protein with EAL and GGDEF domain
MPACPGAVVVQLRAALVYFVRLTSAFVRVATWLLIAPILFTIAVACYFALFSFAAPMIAWRAARRKDTSRP